MNFSILKNWFHVKSEWDKIMFSHYSVEIAAILSHTLAKIPWKQWFY